MISPSIDEIELLKLNWPTRTFQSKSGGTLQVLNAIPITLVQRLLQYDQKELENIPDIRGFRSYQVSNIPQGTVGGLEFHKVRKEIIYCTRGNLNFILEDITGKIQEVNLEEGNAVYFPSYIMHTYTAKEDKSSLLVIANTLFDPNDKSTHDTYSMDAFRALQEKQI